MNDALFEQLLYEEESTTLDFKKEQYRFAKATEDEKSELLKDILGFANAWRRSEAYILIGVEDVRGGRGNVTGIPATDQLDDHSLQQFVNNLTNRAIRFHYEAFGFDGKQVGVIRIEEQARPLYLKKDYGKLKKGEVYIRRGSSTDPTKPADPDEIASMGRGREAEVNEASLAVEFADPDREQPLGAQCEWSVEFCHMPDPKEIMSLNDPFYHQLANYIFLRRRVRKIRFVVTNTGEVPATDVRLEISVPNSQGFGILADIPDPPKRRERFLAVPIMKNLSLRPAFRHAGYVVIDKNDHQTKVEIECGSLQPGRKVWTDTFFIGIGQSGRIELSGHLFAANLPQPQEFTLSINATITETRMTVDDLVSKDEPSDDD